MSVVCVVWALMDRIVCAIVVVTSGIMRIVVVVVRLMMRAVVPGHNPEPLLAKHGDNQAKAKYCDGCDKCSQ